VAEVDELLGEGWGRARECWDYREGMGRGGGGVIFGLGFVLISGWESHGKDSYRR
jgi:hypothetical protein